MNLKTLFSLALVLGLLNSCAGQSAPLPFASHPINDTGIISCIDETNNQTCPSNLAPNQDGENGRDSDALLAKLFKIGAGNSGFDFTKLGRNGTPLPIQNGTWVTNGSEDNGTSWSCIQDNVTGLIWEAKSDNSEHVNYRLHTYSWYNPRYSENGGIAGSGNLGSCSLSRCDTLAYAFNANESRLCGLSNWRLPSVNELLSIVDQSHVNPAIDTNYFPHTEPNAHWTNASVAENPASAWYVYFTAGGNGNISKDGLAHIRLVAEGK